MSAMNTSKRQRVRRWCEHCKRYTASEMEDGNEICAEHVDEPEDLDFWADIDEEESDV